MTEQEQHKWRGLAILNGPQMGHCETICLDCEHLDDFYICSVEIPESVSREEASKVFSIENVLECGRFEPDQAFEESVQDSSFSFSYIDYWGFSHLVSLPISAEMAEQVWLERVQKQEGK